jgi:hypothetical protein
MNKVPPFFYSASYVYKQGASGFVAIYILHPDFSYTQITHPIPTYPANKGIIDDYYFLKFNSFYSNLK